MNRIDAKWFEDDAFWERFFPFMFPEASFVAAAESVPKIAALTGFSGGRVLDLACGPGRYAIPYALAGTTVTAVDRTRFLLDKGRERATRVVAQVEWLEADMREFVRPRTFDLALNLFTSFGYFDEQTDNVRVLENIHASLKPGGLFVFDHLGKELLAAKFQPTRSETLADGTVVIHRMSVVDDWSRIEGDWILIEGKDASTYTMRHWLYSGREIKDLFEAAGFGDIRLFGSFDGTPYGPSAQRLIAVARKPAS